MSNNVDIGVLLGEAKQEGNISAASANVLTSVDIGDSIREGLGTSVDDIQASEVTLVTMLIDDSGSIRFGSNTDAVIDGHNLVLDSMLGGKQKQVDNMLAHTCYLNGTVLFPFRLIGSADRMNRQNFNPNGGTPLYEATIVTLGRVLMKAQEFSGCGVPVRTITLIVTDGASTDTSKTVNEVKTLVKDMLKKETHIIAGMGISDGSTDFRQIFKDMGILDQWILTPNSDQSSIRGQFGVFSKSAVRASQNAASFSSTLGGGFANTPAASVSQGLNPVSIGAIFP